MKKTKTLYWVFTGLFAAFMLMSAIPDIFSVPQAKEVFNKLNLPYYLIPFVGVAKTLGVIAILIPGYPRLKEWAYAGLIFDLIGAGYCLKSSGAALPEWGFIVIPVTIGFLSYAWYHKKSRVMAVR
jgi:uncharacterized membrane protein YphA (DoxX/SURF4 family)